MCELSGQTFQPCCVNGVWPGGQVDVGWDKLRGRAGGFCRSYPVKNSQTSNNNSNKKEVELGSYTPGFQLRAVRRNKPVSGGPAVKLSAGLRDALHGHFQPCLWWWWTQSCEEWTPAGMFTRTGFLRPPKTPRSCTWNPWPTTLCWRRQQVMSDWRVWICSCRRPVRGMQLMSSLAWHKHKRKTVWTI